MKKIYKVKSKNKFKKYTIKKFYLKNYHFKIKLQLKNQLHIYLKSALIFVKK